MVKPDCYIVEMFEIKQLQILTSGMQQGQVWFVVLCTVMLAPCRLCQHICDWDSCQHTPTSDTFSVRRCTEHVSDQQSCVLLSVCDSSVMLCVGMP